MGPELPPLDPLTSQMKQQAQADNVRAIQAKLQGDTASLLARYGSRLAMANAATPGNLATLGKP